MDEKTPHMHLSFCPITPDKRLSAKDILSNQVQIKTVDEHVKSLEKAVIAAENRTATVHNDSILSISLVD